jgi:hypothetical protein
MDLVGIGLSGMDWIDLAHDRDHWKSLLNKVMNLRVPKIGKFLSTCKTGGFLRRVQLYAVTTRIKDSVWAECRAIVHAAVGDIYSNHWALNC